MKKPWLQLLKFPSINSMTDLILDYRIDSWTSFLLQFTEEKVLLEDGAFIKLIESGFRDSFSSLITAGIRVKIPVRPPKGIKVEDSTTIRHQFLQLIVRFWNQLGIKS